MDIEQLEELSLQDLYRHCPLCGEVGKNNYCDICKFTWENDKVYFSSPTEVN